MSVVNDFIKKCNATTRPIAETLLKLIETHDEKLKAAIKWKQLTFGIDNDFDHWICAVSVTKEVVVLKFHFGSLLKDEYKIFTPDDSKFIRKIEITSPEAINEKAIKALLNQAIQKLPYFKQHWKELAKQ